MTNAPLAALAAIAVALGVVIWAEWPSPAMDTSAGGPARPLPPRPGEAPRADAERRAALAATILSRPLFSPGRRPPAAAASGPSAPVLGRAELPRMTGIMIDGAARHAIFASPGGGRPIVVTEGGRIGAFTVQSIEPQRVTVTGPDGAQIVRATFDPRPPPASTAPPGLAGLAGAPMPVGGPIAR